MAQYSIQEAKTHLSRILNRVAAGEEVILAKDGVPIAKLVPLTPPKKPRVPGLDVGKMTIPPDFDSPLPDSIVSDFHQSQKPPS